ncbi:MAG: hypothetical protein ACWA41_05580 [Putridiphycobacter sp.]
MKKVFKIAVIIYFSIVFPILFFVADFFILNSNPKIYSYIPQDADIIIEINTKNFIQEVAYQRIFNEAYFLEKLSPDDESEMDETNFNIGLDFYSQVIFFRENWSDTNLWYAIISIQNKNAFENYLADQELQFNIEYADNYAIILLNNEPTDEVMTHQKNIAAAKVKSFDAKVDLSETFSTEKEMNIYIAPKNSKHIIDGYLHVDFKMDRILTEGTFTPIGKIEDIPFINYEADDTKALTLRSSLNLFNSVYLFNKNIALKDLPEYEQLAFDFDGTTLLTSHSEIPITAYPNLNLQFDISDSIQWQKYIDDLDSNEAIDVDRENHKFIMNTESKSVVNYSLSGDNFSIFQNPNQFNQAKLEHTYFYVNMQPNMIMENTVFKEDSLNPPTTLDGFKISIVESLMDDLNFWNGIENINFTIKKPENRNDFVSNGVIVYSEKEGHAVIESIVLSQQFMASIGAFL